jgi:hypothetical protein
MSATPEDGWSDSHGGLAIPHDGAGRAVSHRMGDVEGEAIAVTRGHIESGQ